MRLQRYLVFILLAWSLSAPARTQIGPVPESLNMFQLIARSDLVALVKVRDGSLKYAMVDVVESIKGSAPSARLRIAFRDFNFTRERDEDPIVFPSGQQEILFLVPYKTPRRRKDVDKYKDLFTLYKGRQGRFTLPAEGPGIILEAVRTLAGVSRLDAASQVEALQGFLDSPNPFLVEVSLSEIERLRVADARLLTRLTSFFRSPSPALRTGALRVVAQVFVSPGLTTDGSPDEALSARALVLERARNDQDEAVRVQAVTTLAAWPNRSEVDSDLRAIATTDAAQAVRYEAERALFKR